MKTITGKAVTTLLIALALLTLFFFLLARHGLSLAVSREAATVESKMDSIADLVQFLHNGERERTGDWLMENNERAVRLMSGALRRYADGDSYTGPRLFPEGAVVEVRGLEAIYPEEMPEGFIRLTDDMIAGLAEADPQNSFIGFMTGTSQDGDMTWNAENIDSGTEAEEAVSAALFCGKIADHFYYVEKTSGAELDDYIDLHVGTSESFQAAEHAYGGAILELNEDLTLRNESAYFPGVGSAEELGLTREMIDGRVSRCQIRDVMYQCVYRTEDYGRMLIYLHPIADIEEQSYRVSALICLLMLPFFLALICYVISSARHVRAKRTAIRRRCAVCAGEDCAAADRVRADQRAGRVPGGDADSGTGNALHADAGRAADHGYPGAGAAGERDRTERSRRPGGGGMVRLLRAADGLPDFPGSRGWQRRKSAAVQRGAGHRLYHAV